MNNSMYGIWELSDYVEEWMLSERDKLILDCGIFLVENRASIRDTAMDMSVSKSSLHRWLHNELLSLSDELSYAVSKQLKDNVKNKQRFCKKHR